MCLFFTPLQFINYVIMNKLLNSVYYDTSSPACFAGVQAVYREAKKRNPNVTVSDVRKFLHGQYTYTVHRPIKRKFRRNKVKSLGVNTNWQIDLADMSKLSQHNDGFKYLLVCYDVFSKYARVEPVKNKSGPVVTEAMKKIFKRAGKNPMWIYSDKGKEFCNSHFQNLMKSKFIDHKTSNSPDVKAPNCERYIRTLKERLWKYFTKTKTKRYIKVLQRIVEAINSSYNQTIGCRPIDVTQVNEEQIRKRVNQTQQPRREKIKVGTKVRIAKEKTAFKKGYLQNFTDELFIVKKCLPRKPEPVYVIEDLHGNKIEGVYYSPELVPYNE